MSVNNLSFQKYIRFSVVLYVSVLKPNVFTRLVSRWGNALLNISVLSLQKCFHPV